MTTMTMTSNSGSGFGKFLLFMILSGMVILGIYFLLNQLQTVGEYTNQELLMMATKEVIVSPTYSHADTEHPDTAPRVRQCLKENGTLFVLKVDKSRVLRICQIDATTFGFQIVDFILGKALEKTSYIKDSIYSLDDLYEYVIRSGYEILKGIIPG